MALPKWTDERTAQLTAFIGDESPVSQSTVAEAADQLETSPRSVSSKLRKMGFDVELASASATRAFSEAQEATLLAFVTDILFFLGLAPILFNPTLVRIKGSFEPFLIA